MINRTQAKMARVALGWGVRDLAREAGLTPPTVTKFETGGNVTLETVDKIQRAFEKAGVTWVPENGGPAGVRPPPPEKDGQRRL